MTVPIDSDSGTRTPLRTVTLNGPPGASGLPLWTLVAGAPHFGFRHAFDAAHSPSGTTADHAHPVRVLAIDPPDPTTRWRRPRLVDVHLAVGAGDTTGDVSDYEFADERLILRAAGAGTIDAKRSAGATFVAIVENGDDPGGHALPLQAVAGEAPFVHLVGEPLGGASIWPADGSPPRDIEIPSIRLVAGRIGLTVQTTKVFSPLQRWGVSELRGTCQIWLTPDGIEFDACLPVPLATSTGLCARVRLSIFEGKPVLDFLRPSVTPEAVWLAAWRRITPDDPDGLVGLRIEARTAVLPAFRWTLENGEPSKNVHIPADAFRIELLGPEVRGAIDGVATLHPRWVDVSALGGGLSFDVRTGDLDAAKPKLTISHAPKRLEMDASTVTFACPIDDDRLARELRVAQGLDTPPLLPTGFVRGNTAGAGFDRPLLAAFVPLDDGWLQFPVPNLGPIDTRIDQAPMIAADRSVPRTGAFTGYLRLRDGGRAPGTLSAWNAAPPLPESAPWQVTIERAGGIAMTVRLHPTTLGNRATLAEAQVDLHDVRVSTRGLLWVSTDRPDALEALPRIGAGPGAFFDVPLEGRIATDSAPTSTSILSARLTKLLISGERTASTLDSAEIAISFDTEARRWAEQILAPAEATTSLLAARAVVASGEAPDSRRPWPAVAWRRHAIVPLAAQMPMTRAAAGAVRPLESRDLIPRAVATTGSDPAVPTIVRLGRSSGEAYARLLHAAGPVVSGWPKDAATAAPPRRGISYAALGMPGVEIRPGAKPSDDEAAVRFDLPLLDEAFASAALPPVPPIPGTQAPPVDAPRPPATALDWVALRAFWEDQERKLQNARVEDSYLAGYRKVGGAVPTGISTLLQGMVWTVLLGVDTTSTKEELPYGWLTLDTRCCGDEALFGYSGTVRDAKVVGFSPSTREVGDRSLDNRGLGADVSVVDVGGNMARTVVYPGAAVDTRLLTLRSPIEFSVTQGASSIQFGFWFKDVLFAGDTAHLPDAMDFSVWTDNEKLARSGFEWRLAPLDEPRASAVASSGRHEIPFFGFRLEALRLEAVTLKEGAVDEVSLLCRLGLGPASATSGDPANHVRLRFSRTGKEWHGDVLQVDASPLSFTVRVDGPSSRDVTMSGKLTGAGWNWVETRLAFRVAGRGFDLPASLECVISEDGEQLTATFTPTPPVSKGEAWLAVDRAALAIGHRYASGTLLESVRTFDLATTVAIRPPPPRGAADRDPPSEPWFQCSHGGGGTTVHLFCEALASLDAVQAEGDGVIRFTVVPGSTVLRSVPVQVSLGLIARLDKATADNGTVELVAGALLGEIVQTSDKKRFHSRSILRSGRIRFDVERRRRGGPVDHWSGTVTVDGTVAAVSALRWPALRILHDDYAIKVPRAGTVLNDGRTTIRPADPPSEGTRHDACWIFDGHRLPIELAAALARNDATTAWLTPVTAMHELRRGTSRIRWRSVETIAIGAANALVPPIDPAHPEDDDITFAARYRNPVAQGRFAKQPDPGMPRAGLGRIGTVLQGLLGSPFRQAFHNRQCDGLMLVGGFLGMLRTSDAKAAPLLRLPVIVGAVPTIGQTEFPAEGLELAWADGPAARWLSIDRSAPVTPGNTSLDALTAAIRAGSRPVPSTTALSGGGAPPTEPTPLATLDDDPVGALLVEQSFANPSGTPTPILEKTPFFVSSAVGIERLWAAVDDKPIDCALCLVAGAIRRRSEIGLDSIPLAAVVTMGGIDRDARTRSAAISSYRRPARIALLGDDLTMEPWTGPDVGDAERMPSGVLGPLAEARHATPRAALFELPCSDGPARYVSPDLGSDRFPQGPETSFEQRVFPDIGRGHSRLPDMGNAAWPFAPIDGAMTPIRDVATSSTTPWSSGIAGMTQRTALPAHAGPGSAVLSKPSFAGVWVSKTQIPVYFGLDISGLVGPPLAWLQPALPKIRLPRAEDVLAALAVTSPDVSGRTTQPFLPAHMETAALGERAGILTVRRTRLLAELGPPSEFDASHPRFGRMAQAGSSLPRTLRTPRPGPLPPNLSNSELDRRVQADPLRPKTAMRAFVGSADVLGGDQLVVGQSLKWRVTVVAAPAWESTVSEVWDGSIELHCRVDLGDNVTGSAQPNDAAQVMLGLIKPADDTTVPRASLKVGDSFIAYRSLRLTHTSPFASPDGDKIRSAVATFILDMTAAPGIARPPDPRIAAALSTSAPLPVIELQWTLDPGARRALATSASAGTSWVCDATVPFNLPNGADLAPVTLRMPLYPTAEDRGALPLTPATVLFIDPAYDRDLAGPPTIASGRVPIQMTDGTALPTGRGDLQLQLIADRGEAHRFGTVTFLLDARFERRMDDVAQAAAEALEALPGGDLMKDNATVGQLRLLWLSADAPVRILRCERENLPVRLGWVHELPLSRLTLLDGSPAPLRGGDALVVEVSIPPASEVQLWHSENAAAGTFTIGPASTQPITRSLTIRLTDDPVAEPPPALYAVMLRTRSANGAWRIGVPLCAQSPLPARVDPVDTARGLRSGMLRRRANFVWMLMRPRKDWKESAIAIVKSDRNGQTHLPSAVTEFRRPECPPTTL